MTAQDNLLAKRAGLAGFAGGVFGELRTNRRAVFGLLAIAVLAGGYGLLLLGDAGDALRASYIGASLRLQRIEASGSDKGWPARAAASVAMRQALEKRLWPADSEGVARANLQDWVTTAGREAGLDKLRVSVELARPKGLAPDLRQVIATIGAPQTAAALTRFLDRIARDPHLLVVDRLHVQEHPVPALEMTLIAYARLLQPNGSGGK